MNLNKHWQVLVVILKRDDPGLMHDMVRKSQLTTTVNLIVPGSPRGQLESNLISKSV